MLSPRQPRSDDGEHTLAAVPAGAHDGDSLDDVPF